MVSTFLERLHGNQVLVADGATGTNLQKTGLPAGIHTEDWIFNHPERILALEASFVEAGADILLTCTFGGSRPRLRGSAHETQISELNQRAASLAREAAGKREGVLVGGSMGPLGQLLQPYGPISYDEAVTSYAEQADALVAGGVDLLVIETQFSLEEAKAAMQAASRHSDMPIIVSFSYDRGTRTIMGVQPSRVATVFKDLGAMGIGVNCGTTLENASEVLAEYARQLPGFPLWAKPNAGLPRVEAGVTTYDVTPAQMARFAVSAADLGARVIGGCCGSTPSHIRAIADAIHAQSEH